MDARLAKIRAKEKAQRVRYLKGDPASKKRRIDTHQDDSDEEQYVLEDYESDREQAGVGEGSASALSAETLKLMKQIGMGPIAAQDEDDELEDETKVTQSSSTHKIKAYNPDFLLLADTFPTYAVHQRASQSALPALDQIRWRQTDRRGGPEASNTRVSQKPLHQSQSQQTQLPNRHQ